MAAPTPITAAVGCDPTPPVDVPELAALAAFVAVPEALVAILFAPLETAPAAVEPAAFALLTIADAPVGTATPMEDPAAPSPLAALARAALFAGFVREFRMAEAEACTAVLLTREARAVASAMFDPTAAEAFMILSVRRDR